jgi:hypothetical protein
MSPTKSVISIAMTNALGQEISRKTSFPISESDIRKWAIAINYPQPAQPLFWDAAFASQTRHSGIVAPEEFNPFAWMTAKASTNGADPKGSPGAGTEFVDPDRTEKELGIPGPGLKFQVLGGLAVHYGERMRPGDVIESITTLASYTEKEGSFGLMLFTVTQEQWTNQEGQEIKNILHTLIRY